jgi:aminopeptidase N
MKITSAAWLLVSLAGTLAVAQRLPHIAVPERYTLQLTPDLAAAKFTGDETIEVRLLEPSASIVLNALDLDIDEATIAAGGNPQKAEVTFQSQQEIVTLAVAQPLPAGPAKIHIRYRGTLNDKLRGFYLAQENGHRYAVTQFEPTDARRAFPCFDEPAYKAVFDLTVVAPAVDTAISNGRIAADEPGPGANQHTIRFASSPKMSTYLVAMLVGDFQCIAGGADGIPIRVCTPPGKQDLGRFGLNAAEQVLKFYDRYFSISYPYGKLDLIAIPDFEAGAMENTAAITFRDEDLLLDEKRASVSSMKEVALVVAHEMAHQWFGDLVTMQWWDDIWLNEGFATWMESKPVAAWKPEWHMELEEQLSANAALAADALRNTRPIQQPAETSAQINELFDAIAYEKTASVLRMLESYEGAELFRGGVNRYLRSHAYANATAEDFWSAEAAVSKQPVDRIMSSFVMNPGVPLVKAEFHCDGATGTVALAQQRFYLDQPAAGSAQELWTIPVCMAAGAQGVPSCVLLSPSRQTFPLPQGAPSKPGFGLAGVECRPAEWMNSGGKGYYRSLPEPELEPRHVEENLTPVERLALAGNEWALVQAGMHRIDAFMGLAEQFKTERSPEAMGEVNRHLQYVGDYLVTRRDRESYQSWLQALLRPAMRELSWTGTPGDDDERRALRATIFFTLGYSAGDPQALDEAAKLLQAYMKNPATVDPTLLDTVFHLAALHGGPALYDQLLARNQEPADPETQYRYLYSLAQFSDPVLLKRTLDYALSPAVRGQNTAALIGGVMRNPAGTELGWQFVKAHWNDLREKISLWGTSAVVRYASRLCSAGAEQDVKQFFAAHEVPAAERSLQQSLEEIRNCVDLKERQEPALAAWLSRHGAAAGK